MQRLFFKNSQAEPETFLALRPVRAALRSRRAALAPSRLFLRAMRHRAHERGGAIFDAIIIFAFVFVRVNCFKLLDPPNCRQLLLLVKCQLFYWRYGF